MPQWSLQSPAEQVAAQLRREIARGTWLKEIPGAPTLARELQVDPKTVLLALELLEHEGLLIAQGVGRRRQINTTKAKGGTEAPPLRIGILLNEASDKRLDYLGNLQHGLAMAGHYAFFARKSQDELGMKVSSIAQFVKNEEADAWIAVSGARDLLEWFAKWSVPTFALFGRFSDLPMAATLPEKIPAYEALVDSLIELGHTRISLLTREDRRLPQPGRTERAFLDRLHHHGITTSDFNLPAWSEGQANFHTMLEQLFRITPPTALIVQEAFIFNTVYHFLSQRGLRVPNDVSLACSDDEPTFTWCRPPVTCIRWSDSPIIRRVVSWAAKTSRGHKDHRQSYTKAEFIKGGTIGVVSG